MAVMTTLVVLAGAGVRAHHSFAAEYDAGQPVGLTGEVVRIDFVNPHAWLHLDVKESGGAVTTWTIEMAAPNNLIRRGLTKDTLPIGEVVTVDGYRARDGSHTVNGRTIKLRDGRTLFTGASNTSAPDDR